MVVKGWCSGVTFFSECILYNMRPIEAENDGKSRKALNICNWRSSLSHLSNCLTFLLTLEFFPRTKIFSPVNSFLTAFSSYLMLGTSLSTLFFCTSSPPSVRSTSLLDKLPYSPTFPLILYPSVPFPVLSQWYTTSCSHDLFSFLRDAKYERTMP